MTDDVIEELRQLVQPAVDKAWRGLSAQFIELAHLKANTRGGRDFFEAVRRDHRALKRLNKGAKRGKRAA